MGDKRGGASGEEQNAAALELELAADEAILACGGDLRETVKALIVLTGHLEDQLASASPAISYGYARGRYGGAAG